jgi:heme oxygenase
MDFPAPPETAAPVVAALREATASQHEQLEGELALLQEPILRERFVRVIGRFLGFHRGWEPALQATLGAAARLDQRSRIELAIDDLRALGLDDAVIDAVPVCSDAARLAADPAHAIGSLYVMEGSTLGGQVISRRLRHESWRPEGGLRYFDPYGPHTGRHWKQTREQIVEAAQRLDEAAILDGAVATFELLRDWCSRPEFQPARA